MKISWGYRVAILYCGFVTMLITMAFLSATSRTDLERVDYYEEELKHDKKMDAIKNMNELENSIEVEQLKNKLSIYYPETFHKNNAEVALWIYSPSNETHDKRISFACNGAPQHIYTHTWRKGIYQLRFSTKTNSKNYYFEKEITIK